MAYIGKTYKVVSSDNLAHVLLESGLPQDKVAAFEAAMSTNVTIKFEKNADGKYTFTTTANGKADSVTFELGTPVEKTRPDGVKYTSTFTLNGDVLKEYVQLATGKNLIVIRKYSADKVESTTQVEGGSCVAKVNFAAA